MLSDSAKKTGYSAFVRAVLRVGETDFAVANIGPGYCVLRSPQELPVDCKADLILTVDGRTYVWAVSMPNGAVPFESQVALDVGTKKRVSRDSSSDSLALQLPKIEPPNGQLF